MADPELVYNAADRKDAVKANLTVTGAAGATLTEGIDYDLTWSTTDVKNADSYTVTVIGKVNYAGSNSEALPFDIGKAVITLTTSASPSSVTFGTAKSDIVLNKVLGDAQGSDTEADIFDGMIELSTDYDATKAADTQWDVVATYSLKAPQNYTVNEKLGQITVNATSFTALLSQDQFTYNATEQKPDVTVTGVGGVTITENVDYVLTWSNEHSKEADTYTVRVHGIGNYECAPGDDVILEYEIKRKPINITASASVVYGTAPADVVYTPVYGEFAEGEDEAVLSGTLSMTSSYTATTPVGIYSEYILVGGLSSTNYEITFGKGTLVVSEACLNDLNPSILIAGTYVYNGTEHTPAKSNLTVSYEKDGNTVTLTDADYDVVYSDNIDAGTAKATITGKGNYSSCSVDGTFTIEPLELTITVADNGKTYGEVDQDPISTWEPSVTLINPSDLGSIFVQRESGENRGTYVIEAQYTHNDNYKVNVVTGTYTISAADMVLNVSSLAATYDGIDHTPTVSVTNAATNAVVDPSEYTLEFTRDGVTSTDITAVDFVKAGSIDIKLTSKGVNYTNNGDATKTFVISAAELPVETIAACVYDGNKHEPVSISGLSDPSDYTVEYTDNVKAGTASYVITGHGNYDGKTKSGSFTIEKAELTVSAQPADTTVVFGSEVPTLWYTVSGFVVGEDESVLTTKPTFMTAYTTTTAAGSEEAVVKATDAEADNYAFSYVDGKITVAKATLVSLEVAPESFEYDGSEHKPTSVVVKDNLGNVVNSSEYTVKYYRDGTETSDFTNGGSITVKAFSNGVNYDKTGEPEGRYEITKKALTITASGTVVYGKEASAIHFDYDYDTFVGADSETSNDFDGTLVATAPSYTTTTAVGTHADYVEVSGVTSNNYEINFKPGSLEVTAACLKDLVAVGGIEASYEYTSEQIKPDTYVLTDGAYTLVEGTDFTVNFGDNKNVVDGGTIEFVGLGNYAGAGCEVKKTFDITPVDVKIVVADTSKVYGKPDPAFRWTPEGLKGSDKVEGVIVSRTNAEVNNAGSYADVLTATFTSNPNYNITVKSGSFTIERAKLTITAQDKNVEYGEAVPAADSYEYSYTTDGFVNGDAEATALTKKPTSTTTYYVGAEVGTEWPVTTSGAEAPNYDITYGTTAKVHVLNQPIGKVEFTATAFDYDGNEHTPDDIRVYDSHDVLIDPSEYVLTFVNSVTTDDDRITPGTITVTATAVSGGNYSGAMSKDYVINKVALTVTAVDTTITYGDAVPEYRFVFGEPAKSNGYKPEVNIDCDYAVGDGAKTYDIVLSGDLSNDYYSSIAYENGHLTVVKAELTVTALDTTITYGDAVPAFKPSYVGLVNGETEIAGISFTTTYNQGDDAGVYTIMPVVSSDNYNLTLESGKLTVEPRKLTVKADDKYIAYGETVSEYGHSIIDGELYGTDIIEDIVSGIEATCDYVANDEEKGKVGYYVIKLSGTDNSVNYDVTLENGTLHVGKIVLTVTAEKKTITYGDEAPEFTCKYSDPVNGSQVEVEYECSYKKGDNAGKYLITPSGVDQNDNYSEITYVPDTLYVLKGDLADALIASVADTTYTGSEIEPVLSVSYKGLNLTEGVDFEVSYSNNVEVSTSTDKAKATITALTGDGKNFVESNNEVEFNILPAALYEIVALPDIIVYTGSALESDDITVYQLLGDGTKREVGKAEGYDISYYNNTEVGTATVVAKGNTNFTVDSVSTTFEIIKATLGGIEVTPDEYPYTGSPVTATTVTVKDSEGREVSEDEGYDLFYYNNTEAGTATVVAKGKGNFNVDSVFTTFTIGQIELVATDVVTGPDGVVYNGQSQLSPVSIFKLGSELELGRDYDTTYVANRNVGTATLTVTGKGNYKGVFGMDFAINPAPLAITAINDTVVFGKEFEPTKLWHHYFVEGEDSTVLTTPAKLSCEYVAGDKTGKYDIVVGGATSTNYAISFEQATLTVVPAELDSTFTVETGVVYTADSLKPTITLPGLTEGDDYEVVYKDNVNAGTATVIVTGKGNYEGSEVTKTFEIVKAPLTITAQNDTVVYGSEAPEYEVVYTGILSAADSSVVINKEALTIDCGYEKGKPVGNYPIALSRDSLDNYSISFVSGVLKVVPAELDSTITIADSLVYTASEHKPEVVIDTLVKDVDFTVVYTDNVNVGTATVIVTGKGNYEGSSFTKTFEIVKAPLTVKSDTLTVTYGSPVPEYTMTVEGLQGDDTAVEVLTAVDLSSDYTDTTSVGVYPIVLTASANGNYELTTYDATLTVVAATIDNVSVEELLVYNGKEQTPAVTIDGLTEGVDFTVEYADNKDAGTASVIVTGKGNYEGSTTTKNFTIAKAKLIITALNDTISYGSPVPDYKLTYDSFVEGEDTSVVSGLVVKCTYTEGATIANYLISLSGATAKNYDISYVSGVLTVLADTLGNVSPVESVVFNNEYHTPAVSVEGMTEGVDYTVEYSDNFNAGIATITVKGIGNYAGEKVVHFTIEPLELTDEDIVIGTTAYRYDGTAHEPVVLVTKLGTYLTEGVDYTKVYANNINVGMATATAVGKGNYTGSAVAAFTIAKNIFTAEGIVLDEVEFTYDMTEKRPDIVVSNSDDKEMTLGKDYLLEYSNNVNAGEATVTVTGLGDYFGVLVDVPFTIHKRPATVTCDSAKIFSDEHLPIFHVTFDNFVENDSTVTAWSEAYVAPGTEGTVGVFQVMLTETVSENYDITYVYGELKIDDYRNRGGFKLYPVPAHDYVIVEGVKDNSYFKITNPAGVVMLRGKTSDFIKNDITVLPPDVYVFHIDGVVRSFIKY